MVSNIAKKEANTIDADQIGKNHGKKEHEPFRPRKVSSMFKKLQKARSRHHRDGRFPESAPGTGKGRS